METINGPYKPYRPGADGSDSEPSAVRSLIKEGKVVELAVGAGKKAVPGSIGVDRIPKGPAAGDWG